MSASPLSRFPITPARMPVCTRFAAPCVLAAALLFIGGCEDPAGANRQSPRGSAPRAADGPPIEVRLGRVSTIPVERHLYLTGTLYGQEEVTVAAKVSGRIAAIHADLGDVVERGGKLAQVETADYTLAVEEARSALLASLARLGLTELPETDVDLRTLPVVARAEAQAINAEAKLQRARKLYDRSPPLISEQEFADIQTQRDVALTELQGEQISARSQLADARVRAAVLASAEKRLTDASVNAPADLPLRYRVAERRISAGEYVSAGTPLFRLVATDRVKFRGSVPERFAGMVQIGAPARLEAAGYSAAFDARVVRIAPAIDPTSRAFEVEIEAENPEQRLKPGGFLRARVRTHIDEAARFVPASALSRFTGVQRVFSVVEGRIVEHKVRTGETRGELVEVLDLPPEVAAVVDAPRRGLARGVAARVVE